MPAYWTGISQPANGTSLAPAATWRSYSGVRLSVCEEEAAATAPDSSNAGAGAIGSRTGAVRADRCMCHMPGGCRLPMTYRR